MSQTPNRHEPLGSGRRALVIFNPAAGQKRRHRLDQVLAHARALGCRLTVRETTGRGDAERFAAEADPAECDLVVAAGGDGTINEVVNGLAGRSLPLAIIPLGTANVLAAEIGLSSEPEAIARAIALGAPRPAYLGRANDRHFAMMVGVGFDAHVVKHVSVRVKHLLAAVGMGKLAYVLETLVQLLVFRPRRYRILVDGVPHEAASAVIAKGRYYGGRYSIAKAARITDPALHVCLFRRVGRLHVLRYGAALLLDRLDRLPDVEILPASRVQVLAPEGEPVQGDGDILSQLPLEVELDRRPLSLVMAA